MKIVFNNCNLEFNKYVNTPVTDSSVANGYLKNIYFVGLPQSVSTLYIRVIFCNSNGNDIYVFSSEAGGSELFRVHVSTNTRNLPYIVKAVTINNTTFTVIIKSENISSIGDGASVVLDGKINLERATDRYNTIQKDIDSGFTDNPNVNLLVTEMYVNGTDDVAFTYIDNKEVSSRGYGVCFGKTGNIYAYQKFQLETPTDNTIFVCSNNTIKIYAIVKWSILPSAAVSYSTGTTLSDYLGPCAINLNKATDLYYSPRIKEYIEQ